MNKDVIFDIECYSNIFTAVFYSVETDRFETFEISERRNDFLKFVRFVLRLGKRRSRMVGFNNYGYDYPVIHALVDLFEKGGEPKWQTVTRTAKRKSDQIINAPHDERFANTIWDNDQVCAQLDLFKIHHFDNVSRRTSLKVLEFNMRSNDIQELPFDPTKPVAVEDIPRLLEYNKHDVKETFKFYKETLPKIKFREKLSKTYHTNLMNANDTKIGKTIFQLYLEESLGREICYHKPNGKRVPRQTFRKSINVRDILFWYHNFNRPEFNAVFDWMHRQDINGGMIKSAFTGLHVDELGSLANHSDLTTSKKKDWGPEPMVKNLNCVVDGFKFVFGTGGLHGCIDPCVVESDGENAIIDLDVVSYYPSLAIVNEIFPKHLGKEFCTIYGKVKKQRVSHAKGTPENAALKLALNGVYGDSNNVYSPFYDPQYTLAVTLNGQLLLCLLAEWLMDIDGLQMIQANTDGVTVKLPREAMPQLERVWKLWESHTGLDLESVEYSAMWIRDVNNYIAKEPSGKLKRKGAYEYDIDWHQNHSALVVQKAAEAHLVYGANVRRYIEEHLEVDPFDFYLRTKVPRTSRLELITEDEHNLDDEIKTTLQNVTRYFISNNGGRLNKVMPPLPKKPDMWRNIAIQKGWNVTVHDKVVPLEDVNFDYYEQEAMKLVKPLTKKTK